MRFVNHSYTHNEVKIKEGLGRGSRLEAISFTLSLVVFTCDLNQLRGYWLFNGALASTISISIKFEMERIDLECRLRAATRLEIFDSKLLLTARMRNQLVRVLAPFLSIMRVCKPSFAHNMLVLMLDPRHKELTFVGSYLGRKEATRTVQEYDERLLCPSNLSVLERT